MRADCWRVPGQPGLGLTRNCFLQGRTIYLLRLRMHGQSVWVEAFVVRHGGVGVARWGPANSRSKADIYG